MSLFENSSTSFGAPGITCLHEHRPRLKRSQTPYHSSKDSKRRRTSPTGAFSRLSLSPTSARPAETKLLNSSLAPAPSFLHSATNHQNGHYEPTVDVVNSSTGINNTFQFGLNNHNHFPYTSLHQSSSSTPTPKEAKMRSTYSAYDIDPNRIFIESLSDGERSPTPSIQLEEDQTQEPSTLELSPKIAHQLSAHHHKQRKQSANILLNSYNFLSDPTPPNDQQLVLYRRPIWPSFPPKDDLCLAQNVYFDDVHLSEPQIVEIDDYHDADIDVLNSDQHATTFDDQSSSILIDSMELD